MKNRTVIFAIGLVLILTLIVPAIAPQLVYAQTCKDARGNTINCPPAADLGGHKKKPTPTRPRDYKTDTPTATPSQTPMPSPTFSPVPIVLGADKLPPQAPDSGSGWPLAFGSTTHAMQFDGDPAHSFPGGSWGFFGLLILTTLGILGLTFVRIRAARINYKTISDDTSLIFQKKKGDNMPLATEIGFPGGDASDKDASLMEIESPLPTS